MKILSNTTMKFYILLITVVLFAVSCSTDVEINAPYKKTTVIYGLLNSDENGDGVSNALDTQWIKINKTFLGTGDNSAFASIRDSSEYQDSDFIKKVVQQIRDGQVVDEFELISKEVNNKSINGVFYAPWQTVYYFTPPVQGLTQTDEYNIVLQFSDGREVSAITNLISYAGFGWQSPQPGRAITLAQTGGDSVTYNSSVSIKWYPITNAEIYDLNLRFKYTELVYDNPSWTGTPISTTEKYLDYFTGSTTNSRTTATSSLEIRFNGQAFFNYLRGSLEKNPNIRRVLGSYSNESTTCFELRLSVGNQIIRDYVSVNSPSTGIVQEKPIYTNVSNGLGLFAARGGITLSNIPLIPTGGTIPNLGNLNAFFTPSMVPLNFCDPNPTSSYACGQ